MDKRLNQSLIIVAFLLVLTFVAKSENYEKINTQGETTTYGSPRAGACDIIVHCEPVVPDTSVNEVVVVAEECPPELEVPEIETSWLYKCYLNMGYSREKFYEDLDLLAAITMAEAGNQSELGKRLVIDTVLNRVNSDRWRDDDIIWEAITHPGQYNTYSNGAYKRVAITEDIPRLVEEEILNRTNSQVIYFKTNGYFSWAPALLKEGDHYFCGEEKQY